MLSGPEVFYFGIKMCFFHHSILFSFVIYPHIFYRFQLFVFIYVFIYIPFLPDNCRTYNVNDNPKNKILMSGNITQKRLTILKYFDAYICHHYQPKIIQ